MKMSLQYVQIFSVERLLLNDAGTFQREEEELFVRETISKIVRRYTVRLDPQGRTLSRDLMDEVGLILMRFERRSERLSDNFVACR